MRSATLVGPSRRLRLLCVLLLAAFLILAARAAHLTVLDSRGKGRGEQQITTVLRLPAPRGLIVDRRGVELAVTIPAPSLYIVPNALGDRAETAHKLAEILDLDPASLAVDLERRRRFTFIKRWITPEQAERVRQLALPGVGILREPRRAYPAGPLAGQLIGFANIDGKGVRAIEQQEDSILRGRERTVTVERDARGRHLVVDPSLPRDTAGGDVRLTLDAKMQASAEAALAALVERTGSKGGSVVTLDPHSGDILSLAEYPPVDPNVFRNLDFQSTRSRAFLDAIEPGSTFKIFVIAGALDAGLIQPDEMIDTSPGWLRVPGKTIRDHANYGLISIAEVLEISSNVAAIEIGQRFKPQSHYELLRRFGFGRSTESGFPQESAGLLRHYRRWQPVDRATLAFGQGVNVTPIQLASATAALANNGVLLKPRLVAARRKTGGEWQETPREAGRRVVSQKAATRTLQMMEHVVSASGTGRRAALRGLRVAGKTGTAQKFDSQAGRYSKTDYLAWFIGVVPADDPQLTIAVVIDEPQGRAHGGGDTAAPLFAQVASEQLALLGIVTAPESVRPQPFRTLVAKVEADKAARAAADRKLANTALPKKRVQRAQAAAPASRRAVPASLSEGATRSLATQPSVVTRAPAAAAQTTHLVPDFRGETLASARLIASQDSLTLVLEGDERGLAVEQHPDPGTVVRGKRPRVRLRFTLDPRSRQEG